MRVYASAEMTLTDTNDGISVTGIDRYYMASSSSSGITVDSPGWKPDPQETNPISRYHWSYEVVNYSSGPPVPSKPAIIGVYGKDGVDSATLAIITPDGTTVRDTTNSLRLDSKLFVGGKETTASSYKWYYPNGSSTTTHSTGKSTSIGATIIKNSLPIFLDATYNGTTYTSSVTINDISDVYTSIILGVATFKNGKGSNTYTVKLYRNGKEIDPGGSIYSYEWEKVNSQGVKDTRFTKTGKTITISASEIDNTNLFNCYIYTK